MRRLVFATIGVICMAGVWTAQANDDPSGGTRYRRFVATDGMALSTGHITKLDKKKGTMFVTQTAPNGKQTKLFVAVDGKTGFEDSNGKLMPQKLNDSRIRNGAAVTVYFNGGPPDAQLETEVTAIQIVMGLRKKEPRPSGR
jgi:hypothetical protein